MKKKILVLIILWANCILLFSNFTLVKQQYRPIQQVVIPILVQEKIKNETKNMIPMDIVNYCLDLTVDTLSFGTSNTYPLVFKEQKANCVGYSQFYAAICNYAFKVNNYTTTCTPVVGYVSCLNINLCNIAHKFLFYTKYKNFVKNHDFVEIRDHDFVFYTDPCLYEILGSDFKSLIIN